MAPAPTRNRTFLIAIAILIGIVALYARRSTREGFQTSGNVYVMYHVYCTKSTKPIVQEQVTAMLLSDLYDEATTIYCFLAGEPTYISQIEAFLKSAGRKFKIQAKGPNDKTYERFTLLKIHDLVKDNDVFLYLHSKGISRTEESIFWWRLYMHRFLMRNISKTKRLLETNDAVGILYRENVQGSEAQNVGPHFSGNFWWATGAYYHTLPREIGPGYNDPETYIFEGNPRYALLDEVPLGKRSFHHDPIRPREFM